MHSITKPLFKPNRTLFVLNDRHPTEQQYHRGRNLSRSLTTHRRQSCQMPSGCQQVGQLTQPMASQRKQWWIKAQFKSGFTLLHKHNSVTSNTYGLIVITLFDSEETVYSIPLWHSRLPKILPHFGSKTNIFRLFVVIVFKHAPVTHTSLVFHTLCSKKHKQRHVYTARCWNSTQTSSRFEYKETKMSLFIAAAKICHRSQPKKMWRATSHHWGNEAT